MKYIKIMKNTLVLVIVLSLITGIFPNLKVYAAMYSDTSGHWAEKAIEMWSERGIIQGSEGKFRPDDPVTRGELAAILNRIFEFPDSDAPLFTDIAGKWYEKDINALAWQEVYVEPFGEAKGDSKLTREEAVYMFSRAFLINERADDFTDGKKPADYKDIDEKYLPYVTVMMNYGFVNGMPNGNFKPKDTITRAQIVTILDNMIDTYIVSDEDFNLYFNKTTLQLDKPMGKRVFYGNYSSNTFENQNIDFLFISTPQYKNLGCKIRDSNVNNLYMRFASGATLDFYNTVVKTQIAYPVRNPYNGNFAGGFGFESAPYLIENQDELNLIRNQGWYMGLNEYFLLTKDIALAGEWKPIGAGSQFYGILDGGGHTISGLNINARIAGLFEDLRGTVENLYIKGTVTAESEGVSTAGAIAAGFDVNSNQLLSNFTNNKIINCTADVNVTVHGKTPVAGGLVGRMTGFNKRIEEGQPIWVFGTNVIENCKSTGSVSAYDTSITETFGPEAGGIVGAIYGVSVINCYSNASVLASGGDNTSAGGIIGEARKMQNEKQIDLYNKDPIYKAKVDNATGIKDCMSEGKIHAEKSVSQNNAGGIIGHIEEGITISTSCSYSDVSASGNPDYFNAVGGLVGAMYGNYGIESNIDNSYSAGRVSSDGFAMVGGLVGRIEGNLTNCYTVTKITAPDAYNDYTVNGLVGPVRSGLTVKSCGVFNVAQPHFVDGDEYTPKITQVDVTNLQKESTYTSVGWDFNDVWTIQSDKYNFPILRGSFEKEQIEAALKQ